MFTELIAERLDADRAIIGAVYGGAVHPEAPLIRIQGGDLASFRLPEYFRGDPEAKVALIGPHAPLLEDEAAPLFGEASVASYMDFYRTEMPPRPPFSHYRAICGERRWIALEMPPWKAPKDDVMALLKSGDGPALAGRSLDLIWRLLAVTPVQTLVISGAETMRWAWPALGLAGKPPTATKGHAVVQGRVPLPSAPERIVKVVTSFHWGPEVPLFCRKVPGMKELTTREAISRCRSVLGEQLD